ncbi:GNAT family N-acetyltransferase [Brevundimonas naejangsanensis]|uniref:GNAT family N-acetyltransferase n=1 Tax=Brevundimonas naejangsanensis TaxID=588932 RepID=A0A494RKJ2_9CAUL|nr:GNAT family N-acetyltransferase [Brevundimonas naejangsanensis]AYG95473.1 GNAT family N-acetyltransferase [Brevundimonas naejangsanensis]
MSGHLTSEMRDLAELSEQEKAQWNDWARGDPALSSPYFRVEFAQSAARFSPGSAVAVFKRDGETVGYYPHQRRGATIQPLAAPMSDYHGVIGPREAKPTLAEAAALMQARRFAVSAWVGQAPTGALRDESILSEVAEGGYAAWYAARRRAFPKYFKDKERARRGLDAAFGSVEFEVGLRDHDLLDGLIRQKSAQYVRTGRHDIFACGWTAQVLHALMDADGEDGFGGSLAVLRVDGRVGAVEYSLHAGRTFHMWFPAYSADLARWAPGILLSMETIRIASERGYREFDYGVGGGNAYKKHFSDRTAPVAEITLRQPGLGAALTAAGSAMTQAVGADRAGRIRDSLRRRWAVIEACETHPLARLKGAGRAGLAALGKARGRAALKA